MKPLKKLSKTILTLAMAVFFLTACTSNSVLTIHANNKYSFSTDLNQPIIIQTKKCADSFPGLEKQLANPNLRIIDQSDKTNQHCHLELRNQPISSARAPFVSITHLGDRYQVTLPPAKQLGFINHATDNFRLEIKFPGPVLDPGTTGNPQVKGNKIWWTDPSVIVQGFKITGQDHPGMTRVSKIIWLLLSVCAISMAGLFGFTLTSAGAPVKIFFHNTWQTFKKPFIDLFIRMAEFIDLTSSAQTSIKSGRRGRHRNQTVQTTVSSTLPADKSKNTETNPSEENIESN